MTAAHRSPVARRIAGTALQVADDQPTFWDRVEAGTWEPGTLAALAGLGGPGTAFLDLGAWVGPLSLLAAARGARVVAVEADPAALDQLRRNLGANPGLAERVEVVAAAVAPEHGTVRLGARRKPGDSMSSVLFAREEASWTALAVTPADLAARLGAAARLVVKIDIEGGEYALLPHLGPLLVGEDVHVLLSLHPVILRESGASEPDTALLGALAPFAGWRARPIGRDGPDDAMDVPDGPLGSPGIDTWLLSRR